MYVDKCQLFTKLNTWPAFLVNRDKKRLSKLYKKVFYKFIKEFKIIHRYAEIMESSSVIRNIWGRLMP